MQRLDAYVSLKPDGLAAEDPSLLAQWRPPWGPPPTL
eukprot:CAMPEP_0182943198 /NCGR_PEP_ID=MMETSP0105_2-20130417/51975_1 /TAXON_ID=81532 ORGANISM="Acanthoeca-like sp., Strain 10tr" /NCGR_SAMPLE_ID=MMETSP0105_2 /ASSEMBLY_ACC=CAM_ASM_000205 /LENGTH=36 /DNA_ID= /DNA_START= /DNA_END= /DNA_ORIENTATION=